MIGTVRERFEDKVMPEPNSGCWLWAGYVSRYGYGLLHQTPKKYFLAHRLAYEFFVGPIPEGLQIDHKCRVRSCVNPAHLEAVTLQENIRRGETGIHQRTRTHCPHGHPYDEANTYRRPSNGTRICRQCYRNKYWERKAASCTGV